MVEPGWTTECSVIRSDSDSFPEERGWETARRSFQNLKVGVYES